VAARRKADVLIREGRVLVNGTAPPPGGCLVQSGKDVVIVDGKVVAPGAPRRAYYAVNKPAGYLSAESDRSRRPLVTSLLHDVSAPVHPVGRLDLDSRGLIILTDDGELSYRLQHPRYHVDREYEATVKGVLTSDEVRRLRTGVDLKEGRSTFAEVEVLGPGAAPHTTRARVVLRQGWKRQVRRSFQALAHRVVDLRRVRIGPLRLGRLKEGGFRRLTTAEVASLRAAVGLSGADASP
jgi:pseudouridine synthase